MSRYKIIFNSVNVLGFRLEGTEFSDEHFEIEQHGDEKLVFFFVPDLINSATGTRGLSALVVRNENELFVRDTDNKVGTFMEFEVKDSSSLPKLPSEFRDLVIAGVYSWYGLKDGSMIVQVTNHRSITNHYLMIDETGWVTGTFTKDPTSNIKVQYRITTKGISDGV